jgi:hypothetical protein
MLVDIKEEMTDRQIKAVKRVLKEKIGENEDLINMYKAGDDIRAVIDIQFENDALKKALNIITSLKEV